MKINSKPTLNPTLFCLLLVGIMTFSANAATVTWQTPTTISGASDVRLDGSLYATWAPGNDWGGSDYADLFPVNGVTFHAYGTPGVSFNFSGANLNLDRYNGFADPGTADLNYNHLLHTAVFNWNQTPTTINWNNMTLGNTYLVELWLNDGRTGQSGFSTFTGGANTSDPVYIGNGAPGQFIVGTFVADSDMQEITMSPGIMINLVQIRDISVVPEPSTVALAVGMGAMLLTFRWKNRRN